MIYEYENSKGERREVASSIKNAPPEEIAINEDGSWSPTHQGCEVWKRVFTGGLSGYVNPFDNKYPYVSSRLPKNMPGCRVTDKGKPIIESKSHEANIAARHGYRRD